MIERKFHKYVGKRPSSLVAAGERGLFWGIAGGLIILAMAMLLVGTDSNFPIFQWHMFKGTKRFVPPEELTRFQVAVIDADGTETSFYLAGALRPVAGAASLANRIIIQAADDSVYQQALRDVIMASDVDKPVTIVVYEAVWTVDYTRFHAAQPPYDRRRPDDRRVFYRVSMEE